MNNEKLYTQEELEIELLKQRQDKFSVELKQMSDDVRSQFYWIMGTTSALYLILISTLITALAKSLKWFWLLLSRKIQPELSMSDIINTKDSYDNRPYW